MPAMKSLHLPVHLSQRSRSPDACRMAWLPRLVLVLGQLLSTSAQRALGWPPLLATEFVDRQSAQAFTRWGTRLSQALGLPLGTPISILRFQPAPRTRALPRFTAGDLVGILPPGTSVPRLYSRVSASRDGVLEICVRRHEHGVCSRFLCDLQPGDSIEAFLQPNPRFTRSPARRRSS